VPLDLETCRQLRAAFGEDLVIGPALYSWAQNSVRAEETLGTLASADTAELQRLGAALPALHAAIHLGPKGLIMTPEERTAALQGPASFQAADVRFLVESANPLNGNQQGIGKTPEWIAAVWEAGLENGNHLVICPSTAVDGTWEPELEKWQADASKEVGIYACTGNRAQREATLQAWQASTAAVKWVVVNPAMIQFKKDPSRTSPITLRLTGKAAMTGCYCHKGADAHEHYVNPYPELAGIVWDTICIDECHKGNIRNHKTITSRAIHKLQTHKRCAMSGTPMKQKGSDIWGILHWLNPSVFTSYWRFAENYFDIEDNGFGKRVGTLRKDAEESLWRTLKPYVIRRTKAEVLPWLPPKHYIEVPCHMTGAQAQQYEDMAKAGFAVLAEGSVGTTSILAEFTRLTQFAFGAWERGSSGKLVPTAASCKLDALLEKMEEADVFDDPSVKQLVFSQFKEVIYLVAKELEARGVKTAVVSGDQNKQGQRRQIREAFQDGDLQVLCIVTTAGGVSLTLDAADTVHMLDDLWSPDEAEQAEDRAHRASRVHQVTIYQYRTANTIDQYRAKTAMEKATEHKRIMDIRRELLASRT
jgi:SNF2 family DNA or RNA helicase